MPYVMGTFVTFQLCDRRLHKIADTAADQWSVFVEVVAGLSMARGVEVCIADVGFASFTPVASIRALATSVTGCAVCFSRFLSNAA